MAQSKTIIDGDEIREKRADKFAIETMINSNKWIDIINIYNDENELLKYSKNNKISMSFIVGRLAREKYIKYNSNIYNKYKNM